MSRPGTPYDNAKAERFIRTLKYEEVYLNDYQGALAAVSGLGCYFRFYNHERLHQGLGYKTPAEIFGKGK